MFSLRIFSNIYPQKRDEPTLKMSHTASTWFWSLATVSAVAVVYGVSKFNLLINPSVATPCTDVHPPMVDRVFFNGFAKIAWSLSVSWVILACVKKRGGIVNSILCWPVWIPLSRVQYCLYLVHRLAVNIFNNFDKT